MKLNAKLVLIMLSLLVIATVTQFILNQLSQHALVDEIQDSSAAISEVLQKSVEDLTSESESDLSRLGEYLEGVRSKGVNEINIINTEGEIIDSSDPEKIGKQRDFKKLGKQKGLKAVPGGKEVRGAGGTMVKPYKLVVPVIIGDRQLGFVEIDLLLDNIREIQHENFIRRMAATSAIFAFGIGLTFFLARRYTQPIHRLAAGVRKVADGDLTVTIPVESGDEVGDLAGSFNEMVKQLKEREDLERRLREAEHLSTVGQLASGIAHEIRNPLNYINLALDHLKEEMGTDCAERRAELLDLADKMKEEVRRANYMVVNFMNYGRPLKVRRSQIDYGELLTRTLPVLAGRLDEHKVTVRQELSADLPLIPADPELLRTCVINFVTNAAQAMADGGTITLGGQLSDAGDSVVLSFADEGNGIAPEALGKIFHPYFTTKEAGIGLGLAITDRIVREHGGTIVVTSSVGKGTTFTVSLPLHPIQPIAE
jgi:signal transduction histidine kinase